MPEITETAVIPTIHTFHSRSVGNPVGYHEPTKMKSTASDVDHEPDRTAEIQEADRDPPLALEPLRLGTLREEDVEEQ